MPGPHSPHRSEVRLAADLDAPEAPLAPEGPLRIGLVGDFAGRGHRHGVRSDDAFHALPRLVDRDSLDEVLAELAPEVHILVDGGTGEIVPFRPTSLDHFHPDYLFAHHPIFAVVRELRRQLLEPARSDAGPGASPVQPHPADSAGLLDQILAQAPTTSLVSPIERRDLQDFLNDVVAPHLVSAPDATRQRLLGQVDAAAGAAMRALLRHPAVQALEGLWRGLAFFLRRVESDALVRVFVVDVPLAELRRQSVEQADPARSALYRALTEGGEGGWDLLVALEYFGGDPADIPLLGWMGELGRSIRAPWLGGADSRLVGCDSLAATPDPDTWHEAAPAGWEALRESAAGRWLGLALPRVLLREPYGSGSAECEAFPFEEWDGAAGHEAYLWGHPALVYLVVLADAFVQLGDPWHGAAQRVVTSLPLHVAGRGPSSRVTPCAEALLGDAAVARISGRGLSPIESVRDEDRVHLARPQTIARPAASWPWQARDTT